MGKNQSKEVNKEEIIIAQAGNSGGQTTSTSPSGFNNMVTWGEILIFLAAIILIIYVAYTCYSKLMKKMKKEIKREASRNNLDNIA